MQALRATIPALLVSLLAWGLATPEAQQQAPQITVRVGNAAWTYTHEQLLAMANDTLPNLKGTRQKPAIPLETILFRDTGLSPEKVQMVVIIGSKTTVLRGNELKYLDKLVLATGPDKGGRPHPWAMAAEDEQTYKLLAPHMGSRRKHGIYRIDIVPKGEAGQ
ncbi:MAG: hypothetical protein HY724_10365 [Candidatus Rokubacteria bacterium]|nr:hypothetical protein [Candidatus Rokubacteria bacterium]